MGCTVALLLPAADPADGAPLAYGAEGGVRLVPIPVSGDPQASRWSSAALRRLLTEFRPEILQVEAEPWWPVAQQALQLAAKVHVPAVLHAATSVAPSLSLACTMNLLVLIVEVVT